MRTIQIKNSDNALIATVDKVISCSRKKSLNHEHILSFVTLLDDKMSKLIEGNTYTAELDGEIYDIVSFSKSLSGNISLIDISAEHISYRLNDFKVPNTAFTGALKSVVNEMLAGSGFHAADSMSTREVNFTCDGNSSLKQALISLAAQIGQEMYFDNTTVYFTSHIGSADDKGILSDNVLELKKSINVLEDSISYSFRIKPKTPVGLGDEVRLVFHRLGINDLVRVLSVADEPFVNENLELQVGAYEPSLESESVLISQGMVKLDTAYYGTKITKDNGLEVVRSDGNGSVVFNSDTMAFYQNGEEVLYFDAKAKKWKLSASMEIRCNDGSGKETTLDLLASGLSTRIQDNNDRYVEIKQTIDGFTVVNESGDTLIDGGMIVTDNIQLNRLIAKGSAKSFVEMMSNGLNFVLGNNNTIGIGYASSEIPLPYIIFGEGASPTHDDSGMIKFYDTGLWIGDSADRYANKVTSGTGLFVDIVNDKLITYTNGTAAEVSNLTNVAEKISELKDYLDGRLATFKPVAVFG